MKVIASSLRKGNIVEIDGKLGVILTTESIHPGKGTPVTQMDVKRIADGVKLSFRFKTTEQVERAFVEDHKHQFMYQDGEGFHFMNMESYDQVALTADIIGDQSAYLQPEMEVTISIYEAGRSPSSCRRAPPSKWSRPNPPSRARRLRPRTSQPFSPTVCAPWCRPSSPPAPRSWCMTADGSYIERAKE